MPLFENKVKGDHKLLLTEEEKAHSSPKNEKKKKAKGDNKPLLREEEKEHSKPKKEKKGFFSNSDKKGGLKPSFQGKFTDCYTDYMPDDNLPDEESSQQACETPNPCSVIEF